VGADDNSAGRQVPLAEHWNGTAWTVVPSPSPTGGGVLSGVAATSPADVWAVGTSCAANGHTSTLIERWNGTAWTRVPSPNAPGATDSFLAAVTVISAQDAWAVGNSASGLSSGLLIEHWNGKAWEIVPTRQVGRNPRSSAPLRRTGAGVPEAAGGGDRVCLPIWAGCP
jgi:hypothetical protein